DAIIKVEKKVLPSKVITNKSREQRSEPKELRDMKTIKTLSILIGKIRKNQGNSANLVEGTKEQDSREKWQNYK
ncbi:22553_t:CDS:2, partial [Gigaspora margarita]